MDGIIFDSIKEADYYGRLKLRVRAGELAKFEVHKVYDLFVEGELITTYEADFVLYFHEGTIRVIDVKSVATVGLQVFRIKAKLMKAIYKIEIQIVK